MGTEWLLERIERKHVLSGKPAIRGTRLSVETPFQSSRRVNLQMSCSRSIRGLAIDDVRACIAYAREAMLRAGNPA